MKYNLFIGRWMPFHDGHKHIIDSFVNNGKPVCIGIRDTAISLKDPFSAEFRKKIIERYYKGNPIVKVMIIPDVEQVVVGRGVGYSVVEAPKDIQQISGTKIRAASGQFNFGNKGFCIWMYGLSGSGKSTIANKIKQLLEDEDETDIMILEGDTIRQQTGNFDYTEVGRKANIQNALELTELLVDRGIIVIAAFMTPFEDSRSLMRETLDDRCLEVYIKCSIDMCRSRDPKGIYKKYDNGELKNVSGLDAPFEEPFDPHMEIDTTTVSVFESAMAIVTQFGKEYIK